MVMRCSHLPLPLIMVKILLYYKADAFNQIVGHKTVLYYAASKGHVEIARMLLSDKPYMTSPLAKARGFLKEASW